MFKVFLSCIYFCTILLITDLAFSARLGVEQIFLSQNGKKIKAQRFILEEVCEVSHRACERYVLCYQDYCDLGGVQFKSRVFKLHKLKDGVSVEQLDLKSDLKNSFDWSKDIIFPKANNKVYGNKLGETGGTTKSRVFKFEINTGSLELVEEYIWKPKNNF